MRLISWNVNGRYSRDTHQRQIAAVAERHPDVIALQEVREESLPGWLDGLSREGLSHSLDSSDLAASRRYFNLVASRWQLRRLPSLQLAFPERYLGAIVDRGGAPFEVHTAHLPPGVSRGLVKVAMFEALHRHFATTSERPRILCGDLNTPQAEHEDGTVEFWGVKHPPHTERWDAAERSVVLGLAAHDLADVYRALNTYSAADVSWFTRGRVKRGRRYDHIFASDRLGATACQYLHEWREQGLSDHSAIEADFAG